MSYAFLPLFIFLIAKIIVQTIYDTITTKIGAIDSMTSFAKNTLIAPCPSLLVLVSIKQSTDRNYVDASDTGLVEEKNCYS
jgi:hypothetical protein